MTIRNKFNAQAAQRGLVLGTLAVSLAGCGMINSVIESDKVDYKTAKKASTLDVPPDLTQMQRDGRYAVPDGRGVATASGYQQQRGSGPVAGEAIGVVNSADMHIERNGNVRWLVVKKTPEQLWPVLKDFWSESGFNLATESANTGVMETEWNENRAKIPQDIIRNTIGKAFDGLYSSSEKDKYRTRLERGADGYTEVYISHRGMEEVITGPQKDNTAWTPRASDPGLEAIFLTKLMVRLGAAPADAKATVAAVEGAPVVLHAKLVNDAAAPYVEVDEGYDRAWRRVGLALDRVGFTVEDRDRVQGMYFVRYVDPDAKPAGFFSRLMNIASSSDKDKEALRFRINVKAAAGASVSQVVVLDGEGKQDKTPTGSKILGLLNDQLK